MDTINTMKRALSYKDEKKMWEKFNEAAINTELHLLDVCPDDAQVAYACVDRDDICVILCDKRTQRYELADETPFGGEIPLWFSEVSHRTSPVYDLYSVIQGLKQYPAFKNVSSISGILFTTTYIINEEDMEAIWKNMGISVRSVKDMSLTVSTSDSRIWNDVTGYLKEKNNVREFVDLDVRVHCSSGTYIRSLARDLGAALGVGAAFLTMLALMGVDSGGFGAGTRQAMPGKGLRRINAQGAQTGRYRRS